MTVVNVRAISSDCSRNRGNFTSQLESCLLEGCALGSRAVNLSAHIIGNLFFRFSLLSSEGLAVQNFGSPCGF